MVSPFLPPSLSCSSCRAPPWPLHLLHCRWPGRLHPHATVHHHREVVIDNPALATSTPASATPSCRKILGSSPAKKTYTTTPVMFSPPHAAPPHRCAPVPVTLPDMSALHHWCPKWRPHRGRATVVPSAVAPPRRTRAWWPRVLRVRCVPQAGLARPTVALGWAVGARSWATLGPLAGWSFQFLFELI
jgi:hypothetical protein